MIVRTAERRDLDAVAERLLALDVHGHGLDARHEVPTEPRIWRNTVEWMLFDPHQLVPGGWVATDGDALVGVLVGELRRGEVALGHPPRPVVQMVWVDPAARRQGVGKALVTAFVAAAEARGGVGCEVSTLAADAAALGFWRALGFADLYVRLRR